MPIKWKEEGNTEAVNGSRVLNVKSMFVGNSDFFIAKQGSELYGNVNIDAANDKNMAASHHILFHERLTIESCLADSHLSYS